MVTIRCPPRDHLRQTVLFALVFVSCLFVLLVCLSCPIVETVRDLPWVKVSRREAMYFRRRGVEESDLVLQDPGKYA